MTAPASASASAPPSASVASSERQPAPDAPHLPCIPLAHKRVPTELREPHEELLGAALVADAVDIAELRAHVLALPEAHWQEEFNREHNVYLQRPFHDRLGVGNRICIFSDTQLTRVYDLPLLATYRAWLEPIWARMGVAPEQVVRCLLARLPGTTRIPAHHDNGPWVSQTHRVHVPIVTFADVEFCSGMRVDTMTRFAFNEGAIVELNNAAKHSVWNPSERARIHLIFDYVEPAHVARITRQTLAPGTLCRQVRGRVEIASDVHEQESQNAKSRQAGCALRELEADVARRCGREAATSLATACRHYFIEQIDARAFARAALRALRCEQEALTSEGDDETWSEWVATMWRRIVDVFGLVDARAKQELVAAVRLSSPPHWVIIGAQKCGTTSLYELLGQHPDVCRGGRREPHFFDWQWHAALHYTLGEEEEASLQAIGDAYEAAAKAESSEELEKGSGPGPELVPANEEELKEELEGNTPEQMRAKYLLALQCDATLRPPQQIGESTPSYLLYGERVARRMKTLYPDMKLLVMLRDPVKRAFSHYQMTADTTGTPAQLRMRAPVRGRSFEQLVEEDLTRLADVASASATATCAANAFQAYADALPQDHGAHSYVGRGLYAPQLALWLRVFPREQVLVLDLDDLKTPEATQLQALQAFAFLNLAPFQVADTARKNTRAYSERIAPAIEQRLRDFYAPFNQQLFELLGRRFDW